jgi:hypothetical protein
MSVPQADSTLVVIVQKIRRLTASANESSLKLNDIYQYVNTYYNQDFPYSIKIDQQRDVYTFFTEPYRDRYPVDVNYLQGFRAPVYFEGIQGTFFKDRQQFYNIWPRFPTRYQQGGQSLSGTITGIAQPTNPTEITSMNHNLTTGAVITISNVGGMTQLNGNNYTIKVIDLNTFSLDDIDNTTYGMYTGGGTWMAISQTFSFQIQGPFLTKEVVLGAVDINGNPISINDDGYGNLQYLGPNPQTSIPPQNTNPAMPGMYNRNTGNPGLINPTNIGTVNYVSGQFDFTLPSGVSLGFGQLFTIWVSLYQTGRPYCLLFWNNELHIRPIPKLIHKVEVEVFQTPVQFMNTTDNPILNQWWQLIAIGAAIKVLEDRQDMEGVDNLKELYNRQQDLVLERQGVEEIFQPNINIFNSSNMNSGVGGGISGSAGYF